MSTINRRPAFRRMAIVPISHELLLQLLGPELPPDAVLIAVRDDPFAGCVEFLLGSDSFPEVGEGFVVPNAALTGDGLT